jgi:hypothetical protein
LTDWWENKSTCIYSPTISWRACKTSNMAWARRYEIAYTRFIRKKVKLAWFNKHNISVYDYLQSNEILIFYYCNI